MKILVSTDDGMNEKNFKVLKEALKKYGEVISVAGVTGVSAMSHSINLNRPLMFKEIAKNEYVTDATPVDNIRLSLSILPFKPDLIVSGVNNGLNIGTDLYYSGTCAIAREGLIHSIPSIAISADRDDKEKVKRELPSLLEFIFSNKLYSSEYFLNINFSNIENNSSKGYKITKLGDKIFNTRFKLLDNDKYITEHDEILEDMDVESDVKSARMGFISITPIGMSSLSNHYYELKECYNDKGRNA